MPIDNLSKITSRSGINTTILLEAGNVNVTGVVTAASFSGPVTGGSNIFAGIVTANSNIHVEDFLIHKGDTNTKVGFSSAKTFEAISNSSTRFRVTDTDIQILTAASAHKVGIGRSDLVAKLDVKNNSNIPVLKLYDSHQNKHLTIRGGGSPNRMIIDSYEGDGTSGAAIDLASGGETKFRVTSDGKVGIGTTVPSAILEITKNAYNTPDNEDFFRIKLQNRGGITNDVGIGQIATGNLAFNTTAGANFTFHNGTNGQVFRIEASGAAGGGVGISTAGGTISPDHNALLIRAKSSVGTNKGHIMLTGDSATVDEGPQIVFSESGSGSNFVGGAIGFRRTGGNSVGDLVFGVRTVSGDADTTPTEVVRITSAKNVGINTDNPLTELHVRGETFTDITIQSERTSGNIGGLNFRKGGANPQGIQTAQYIVNTSGSHFFHSQGSSKFDIGSDGNVKIPTGGNLGINGAAPQSPLDVIANGSGYAVDIRGRFSDETSEIHFCGYDSSPNFAVVGVSTEGGGRVKLTVAGSQRVGIRSDGKVILRSDGASTSDGFAGVEIRQPNGGKHLVLTNTSATADGNEIQLGFKLHGSGQKERIKAGIIAKAASTHDYGQVKQLSFCVNNAASNSNVSIASDEKLRIQADGQVAWNGLTLAQRNAATGVDGGLIYNSEGKVFQYYDDSGWVTLNTTNQIVATGGNSVATSSGYRIHTFTGAGTFVITSGLGEVEVLVVAGGGSEGGGNAGCHGGGGGGGGGVVYKKMNLSAGNYPISIGQGGTWRTNGGNTVFGNGTDHMITAAGGGAGGPTLDGNGNAGGSGGGGSRHTTTNQGGAAQQPGTTDGGFGNAGGNTGSNTSPGGGGGAAGAGTDGSNGGLGGAGKQFTQFGVSIYFGAGGNGNSSGGSAGQTQASTNGADLTGAGGGGSPGEGTRFHGGSGRVMIRYPAAS